MSQFDRWRRRIAVIRAFHVIVNVGSVLVFLELIIALIQMPSGHWNSSRAGLTGGMALFVGSIAFAAFRRCVFFHRLDSYLGPVLDLEKIPELKRLCSQVAYFAGITPENIAIHFTSLKKRGPAEILRDSRRKVHIIIHYQLLVDISADRTRSEAIIWHEFGHFLEWDLHFGYWSFRAIEIMGFAALVLGAAACAIGIVKVTQAFVTSHVTEFQWFLLLISFCIMFYLFGIFWFMRYWRRFCEFNADLTAAIAGHGSDLIDLLEGYRGIHTTRIRELIGMHPNAQRRLKFLRRVLTTTPVQSSDPVRIRAIDYVLGLLIYFVPIWLLFTFAELLLTSASTRL